jgi:hypothetical protein
MKLDMKKLNSLVITYGSIALPVASTAFAMNASSTIKILSFFSGVLPVVIRQANPKDPFTINLLKEIEEEIEIVLEKQKKPTV